MAATWSGVSGPRRRDFIDPRGLSEEAYADYSRILYYADSNGGKSADELLAKYGIQVLVLDGFDRFTGKIHTLAAALADPKQTEWKLVQADNRSMVFMRQPPARRAAPQQSASAPEHRNAMPAADRTRPPAARLRPRHRRSLHSDRRKSACRTMDGLL